MVGLYVNTVQRAEYSYNPFGIIKEEKYYDSNGNEVNKSLINTPYRYNSYRYDEETGNYYLNARYYNPSIGRFISEDSCRGKTEFVMSLNLYTYCINNPVKYIDPSGNVPILPLLFYLYCEAVLTSPDVHMDMQLIADDIARGSYGEAALDSLGFVIPGVTGLGRVAKSKIVPKALSKADDAIKFFTKGPGDEAVETAGKVAGDVVEVTNKFNWSSIKATQEVIEGTNVPRSFVIKDLMVNGKEVWVGGNATKHMGEFINSANKAGGGLLSENQIMESFMNAAKLASEQMLKHGDNRLFVGGWEIGINGETGVIYHALMK
ncbi:RHS repeat-associated core domain-containing protein [Clostridium sp. 'deep sea']|uniref:RHS repeat-associated core domain-containing protein n=1 Tax=Clostridium sp. 'deep sea' TaxID=2779445 RepID=UPI00189642A8|nr:RHS repeat-associated core domain-containing protein [Clostridium sp. 'deep sea']QOR35930.1 RHS repeat-associated core domain-containing protein [Clostridium sp. 'deep sea']